MSQDNVQIPFNHMTTAYLACMYRASRARRANYLGMADVAVLILRSAFEQMFVSLLVMLDKQIKSTDGCRQYIQRLQEPMYQSAKQQNIPKQEVTKLIDMYTTIKNHGNSIAHSSEIWYQNSSPHDIGETHHVYSTAIDQAANHLLSFADKDNANNSFAAFMQKVRSRYPDNSNRAIVEVLLDDQWVLYPLYKS